MLRKCTPECSGNECAEDRRHWYLARRQRARYYPVREGSRAMTERISRRQFVAAAGAAAMLGGGLTPRASGGFDDRQAQVKLSQDPPWNEQGILNLAHSPHAKLRNVPVHAVRMDAGFWASRRTANVERSIPSMGKLLEANGRMDNFL